MFLCDRHGPNVAAHVCEHVAAMLLAGGPPVEYESLTLGHISDPDLGLVFECHLCDACRRSVGLPPAAALITEDEFCRLAETIKPVCGRCLGGAR
jgi:hypothetical protein